MRMSEASAVEDWNTRAAPVATISGAQAEHIDNSHSLYTASTKHIENDENYRLATPAPTQRPEVFPSPAVSVEQIAQELDAHGDNFDGGTAAGATFHLMATRLREVMGPTQRIAEVVEALKEIRAIARKYATSLKQGDVENDFARIASECDTALSASLEGSAPQSGVVEWPFQLIADYEKKSAALRDAASDVLVGWDVMSSNAANWKDPGAFKIFDERIAKLRSMLTPDGAKPSEGSVPTDETDNPKAPALQDCKNASEIIEALLADLRVVEVEINGHKVKRHLFDRALFGLALSRMAELGSVPSAPLDDINIAQRQSNQTKQTVIREGSALSRSAEEVAKEVAHDVLLMVQDDSPGQYWIDKCGAVVAPIIQQAIDGAAKPLRDALESARAFIGEYGSMPPGYNGNIINEIEAALAEHPAAPDQKGASCTSRLD